MNGTTSPPTLPALSEVLIAGAGPTGLTLAVALTTYGVPCTIINALPHGANSSRAAVVHARTLEVLHPLNIADPLISEGLRATRFTIRDRDRALMTIGFADLPTSYPYTLMVSRAT